MAINQTYIREVFLAFENKENSALGRKEFFSDGSKKSGVRIEFSIIKTLLGSPNMSNISVYNLALDTRRDIAKDLQDVTMTVGHRGQGQSKITSGGILSVVPKREGPDVKSLISFYDGYKGIVKGVVQRTFGPGVKLSQIVEELARTMPGISVSPSKIKITGAVGTRGRTFNGATKDELNQLAEEYGFAWSIQDNVFQALEDGKAFNNVVEISAARGNLFSATALISGNAQTQTGVEISALLDPTVVPGDKVNLISVVDPDLNGIYKVHSVTFTGDTFGSTWEMRIQSYKEF